MPRDLSRNHLGVHHGLSVRVGMRVDPIQWLEYRSNDITLAGGMGMMEWNTAGMYNLNGGER